MKIAGSLLLAATLLAASPLGAEESDKKKAAESAKQAGKTAAHGTTAVGKGGSKIYHDVAAKVHKTIAKNARSPKTEAKHAAKAEQHKIHAKSKAAQSKAEMNRAKGAADATTKP